VIIGGRPAMTHAGHMEPALAATEVQCSIEAAASRLGRESPAPAEWGWPRCANDGNADADGNDFCSEHRRDQPFAQRTDLLAGLRQRRKCIAGDRYGSGQVALGPTTPSSLLTLSFMIRSAGLFAAYRCQASISNALIGAGCLMKHAIAINLPNRDAALPSAAYELRSGQAGRRRVSWPQSACQEPEGISPDRTFPSLPSARRACGWPVD
jgi:hypothetical protein